jgi:hypothetical protein
MAGHGPSHCQLCRHRPHSGAVGIRGDSWQGSCRTRARFHAGAYGTIEHDAAPPRPPSRKRISAPGPIVDGSSSRRHRYHNFVLPLVSGKVPAQLFARWTLSETNLKARATLQVLTSGALFLFLVPEVIFATGSSHGWRPLLSQPRWLTNLELQGVALLAMAGVSAVQEFALRGGGSRFLSTHRSAL